MKKLWKLTTMATLIFAATIMAQPFGHGGMGGFSGMGFWKARLVKALNLTDKQKAEFLKLKTTLQTKVVDLRAQIQKNNLKLKELYAANNLDEPAIRNLIKANGKIQLKIKSLMVDNWFKMYNLLDKDQQKIFKKATGRMLQGMKAKMMRAFAHGRQGFDGKPCRRWR